MCVVGKKLPFAEYSVVKELTRLQALGAWLQAWLALATSKFTPPGLEPIAQSQEPELGGEYRARTGDLLVANQALSQLS